MYKPPGGAYIRRGDLTEGFFALQFWGAHTWSGLFSEFYGRYEPYLDHKFIPLWCYQQKYNIITYQNRIRNTYWLKTGYRFDKAR